MTLGEKIQELRKQKGMSQNELAEKLNVSPQAVSKWENSVSMPDISLLPELSKIFDVSIDHLFSNEKTPEVQLLPEAQRKNIDEMYLRVNVIDGGDKVKVNVPLALIVATIQAGIPVDSMISFGDSKVDFSKIDFNKIIELVEKGMIGKIIEIEGEGGEYIVVEVC